MEKVFLFFVSDFPQLCVWIGLGGASKNLHFHCFHSNFFFLKVSPCDPFQLCAPNPSKGVRTSDLGEHKCSTGILSRCMNSFYPEIPLETRKSQILGTFGSSSVMTHSKVLYISAQVKFTHFLCCYN